MSSLYRRNEFLWIFSAGLTAGRALAEAEWIPLIKGNTLDGWHKMGAAEWRVENGVIMGRQGAGWAGGDLYTDREWTDFEFEGEWKVRWPANSGIWFRRSDLSPGYQIDVLDQPRYPGVLSGSIVRMGKGFIAENRDAASVNREAWNKVRLRVAGDKITVEQNGKQVVEVHDNTFSRGSLGIEVHGGKTFEGMEISMRNFRARGLS